MCYQLYTIYNVCYCCCRSLCFFPFFFTVALVKFYFHFYQYMNCFNLPAWYIVYCLSEISYYIDEYVTTYMYEKICQQVIHLHLLLFWLFWMYETISLAFIWVKYCIFSQKKIKETYKNKKVFIVCCIYCVNWSTIYVLNNKTFFFIKVFGNKNFK